MGAWQQIAALPNVLASACAVYHPDEDKVYVFSGARDSSGINRTTYILDPDTNTWSTGALIPATGVTGQQEKAFVAADGKIHVLNSRGTHYRYDPTTNTWDTRAANALGRDNAMAFMDSLGRIILAGGNSSIHVERYDPVTNVWTTLPTMPSGASEGQYNSVGVLGDDGLLYSGYQSFCEDLVSYDPAGPTWGRSPSFPELPSGAGNAANNVPISRLPNGLILRLPCMGSNLAGIVSMRRIDGYNPATGLWEQGVIPNFIGSVYNYPAVATDPAGRIWIMGGQALQWTGSEERSKSSSYVYLQNRAPTAASLVTLTGAALVSTAVANRARHTFNDPDTGDSQSKFDWRYRIVGDASWTTGTANTPNPWHDIAAGDMVPGDYERQVKTYDAGGLASPWTSSGFFTAADPPDGPTITYPVNGQLLEQIERVDWSTPVQDSYQVRRVADDGGVPDESTIYYDTGEVVDAETRTLPLEFETNSRTEHVQVRVKDGGLWSDWVSVSGDVSYTPPPTPEFDLYVDTPSASLLLMIATGEPEGDDPPAVYVEVWIDDGDGEERKATDLPINVGWRYWTPVSGRDYSTSVRVVAVSANGTTASSS